MPQEGALGAPHEAGASKSVTFEFQALPGGRAEGTGISVAFYISMHLAGPGLASSLGTGHKEMLKEQIRECKRRRAEARRLSLEQVR